MVRSEQVAGPEVTARTINYELDRSVERREATAPRVKRITLAAFVAHQAYWIGLPGILLTVALLVSYVLWLVTPWRIVPRLGVAYAAGVVLLVAHGAEELLTGFPDAFPALFGRPPWSARSRARPARDPGDATCRATSPRSPTDRSSSASGQ